MKKIEAIIRKTKFEDVKDALLEADIEWFSYYDVRGIGKKHIESDAGRQCSLAVLAGDFDIGIAEAARTVGEHPAEDVPDDELLPRFE